MIDLSTIPAERLALLDTAIIYKGPHSPKGQNCKHCARELLHEVVTGQHADANPPGCTVLMEILPRLNDGSWRDDAHRTEVMRPYLRKMLSLDPIKDEQRIYAVIDHVYRSVLPDVCDALKLDKHGSTLRDLDPIMDHTSARDARDARDAIDARAALDALDGRAARAALDALAAIAARDAIDARAAIAAIHAIDALDALAARAGSWESGVVAILDRICAIN